MTRESILEQALNLSKHHRGLILNWATGVGKSRAAISIAKEHNPQSILLIVAETAHKKNWEEEFLKWGEAELWKRLTVECYASLKNYGSTEWDMVILDEGHHAMSELRMDILSKMNIQRLVVLTATLSEEAEMDLNLVFGEDLYKYTVTLQDAITHKLLPTPKIYLYGLDLDRKNYTEEIKESWGKSSQRVELTCPFERMRPYNKKDYPAANLVVKCTPFQKYNYLTNKAEYYKARFKRTRQEFMKINWLRKGNERKRLLAKSKTEKLQELVQYISDKRFICFCGSIEQANLINAENSIHSDRSDSSRVIERFNRGEINSLFAVNMLQEGQNLNNIQVGIIAQLDGQERAFIQKFGRTLRAEDPVQIIMYFRGTRDEEYLNEALKGINPDYTYEINTLEELSL